MNSATVLIIILLMQRHINITLVYHSLRPVLTSCMARNCSEFWISAQATTKSTYRKSLEKRLNTRFGNFQWTRISMGICTARATYSCAITLVMHSLQGKEVIIYLDDVIALVTDFWALLQHCTKCLTSSINTI